MRPTQMVNQAAGPFKERTFVLGSSLADSVYVSAACKAAVARCERREAPDPRIQCIGLLVVTTNVWDGLELDPENAPKDVFVQG
ncbi:hypothetical protein BH160DRAFT_0060 [Burkholderia sp. H160]|nr:hypothetical protein BH160DRAFT_0060 [Burkholderia sp. H160]